MITPGTPSPKTQARRELRREEMVRFGTELAWLEDPSLIPATVADIVPGYTETPYDSVSAWMVNRVVSWSEKAHSKLDYAGTFEKYDLAPQGRVSVRDMIREQTEGAYSPGITAMGQVFEVTPYLAARDGINDPTRWAEIALQSKDFGSALAKDGTYVQGLVRTYLSNATLLSRTGSFDPSNFKLGEDGITTVTPVDRLIDISKEVLEQYIDGGLTPNICSAMQAPMQGSPTRQTMYDAFWNSYRAVTEAHIYPRIELDPQLVAKEPHQPSEDEVFDLMMMIADEHSRAQETTPPAVDMLSDFVLDGYTIIPLDF